MDYLGSATQINCQWEELKELPTVGDAPCDTIIEKWHSVARAVYFWGMQTVTSQIPSGLVCLAHRELQNGEEETANGGGMVPSSHT